MDNLEALKGDARIIQEAKDRFVICEQWEATARPRFIEDIKFANADADNGYQWPNNLQKSRIDNDRPVVTINKTQQHNFQIINDAKQNKPGIKIRPVGEDATFDSAEIFEGIVRHIEYISNAQVAYDTATTSQVEGGIGYWRIITDYCDNDTFDQDLFIRRIKNPLSVYIDPDITEKDGSDARYAFIFDDVPTEEFDREYPKDKEAPRTALGNDTWLTDNHIRIAEYYRINEKKDMLIAYQSEGVIKTIRRSQISKELADELLKDENTQSRDIVSNEVEWYKIAGDKIIDRKIKDKAWPGKYIPIVRVVGKETLIDGQMDRKGHTRSLKDPQRMYNYNSAASIEYGALQTKAPWIAPAQAIEEYTEVWENANTKNYSVLPYNHVDDDGNPLEAPQRIAPPQGAQFYVEERASCAQDMMFVSGQYQAMMGAPSNEQSGKAINERQRQGDNATYHFIDNLGIAIRFTGKILIDLIPKIYDTPRVIRIMAKDGTEKQIKVDPNAKQALMEQQAEYEQEVQAIFNPMVGKYDVEADIGPAYATRRQEAWNAITQILQTNEALVPLIGDLLFMNGDFPGADEIAERLKRMVPPQALGQSNPALEQMQEQMKNIQGILQQTIQELAEEKLKFKGKEEKRDIEAYKAITDRLDMMAKYFEVPAADKAAMLHDVMLEEHKSSLNSVTNDSEIPAA